MNDNFNNVAVFVDYENVHFSLQEKIMAEGDILDENVSLSFIVNKERNEYEKYSKKDRQHFLKSVY